jgi:hypothetical protein
MGNSGGMLKIKCVRHFEGTSVSKCIRESNEHTIVIEVPPHSPTPSFYDCGRCTCIDHGFIALSFLDQSIKY